MFYVIKLLMLTFHLPHVFSFIECQYLICACLVRLCFEIFAQPVFSGDRGILLQLIFFFSKELFYFASIKLKMATVKIRPINLNLEFHLAHNQRHNRIYTFPLRPNGRHIRACRTTSSYPTHAMDGYNFGHNYLLLWYSSM